MIDLYKQPTGFILCLLFLVWVGAFTFLYFFWLQVEKRIRQISKSKSSYKRARRLCKEHVKAVRSHGSIAIIDEKNCDICRYKKYSLTNVIPIK